MSDLKLEIANFIKSKVRQAPGGLYREALVRFASAYDPLIQDIKNIVGPHHHLPQELLPEVKTIVAFFLPFSPELVAGNRGGNHNSVPWGEAYTVTNLLLNKIGEDLVEFMAAKGFAARAIIPTMPRGSAELYAPWSHRSIAYVAGLGRFGRNNMLIGPSGGAGRYCSTLLGVELEPDPMQAEDFCLKFAGKKCDVCLKVCPVEAFADDACFDRVKCDAHAAKTKDEYNLEPSVCGKCAVAMPCAVR